MIQKVYRFQQRANLNKCQHLYDTQTKYQQCQLSRFLEFCYSFPGIRQRTFKNFKFRCTQDCRNIQPFINQSSVTEWFFRSDPHHRTHFANEERTLFSYLAFWHNLAEGRGVSKFEPRNILRDRIDIFIVIWWNSTFVTRDFINHHYSYHMHRCQNC